jgi:hypothetical protein
MDGFTFSSAEWSCGLEFRVSICSLLLLFLASLVFEVQRGLQYFLKFE